MFSCYDHYSLNPNFKTLLVKTLPEKLGEESVNTLYEVCGFSPKNLDPFYYRQQFFQNGKEANQISTDTNANIKSNSIVQYQDEVHKGLNKLITYNTLYNKLEEYYDTDTADICLTHLITGTIFMNDTISFDQPYCYGFDLTCLLEGLTVSNTQALRMKPVKYSGTFISQFIQLLAVSSAELLGACAFPNFFVILDWFYRKEFGNSYAFESDLDRNILQDFQHIIYSVNWNFRRSQTAFTNLSVLDTGFLERIFGNYKYPDYSDVDYTSVKLLSQKFFEYFERTYGKDGVPTFPVMTLAVSLDSDRKPLDPEFFEWVSKVNCNKSIANILMTEPTSFSSCCRLKNDLSFGQEGFQNSFGVSSVSVGSHRVCGINLPRLPYFPHKFDEIMDCIHKILLTHRRYLKELIDKGLLPLYTHNLMFLSKQYSTIGFIGVPEFHINNEAQKSKIDIQKLFTQITVFTKQWQAEDKEFKAIYNIEQIPGEMMASRLPIQDTVMNYNQEGFDLYSNQYVPLTVDLSIDERLKEQAKYEQYTSGGSILHISMFDNEPINSEHYKRILQRAMELGVTYLGINYCYSVCTNGHTMIGQNYTECPSCAASIENVYTRVVGFITNVKNWSVPRQKEFLERKSIKC